MILISLDEGGVFEQISEPQCMIIGGLAFQCKNRKDIRQERNSLDLFFKTICTENECNYPAALHPSWNKNGKVINRETVTKIKNALEKEMPDYLQKKGRWAENRPANGQYYAFCMVGDRRGLDDDFAGNLHDKMAAVRYDHMVYRILENLLFFNPVFRDEKDFILDLPTRVVNLNSRKIENREQLEKELKELGYPKRNNGDGTYDDNVYVVTDETGFRVCLEYAQLNSGLNDLHFDLNPQSISYRKPFFNQMFLYLADTLCSIYQNAYYKRKTVPAAMNALQKCCVNLVGYKNTLLFAYHPVDQEWRNIWHNYTSGDWFEALNTANNISLSTGTTGKMYVKSWIHLFEKSLTGERNFPALSKAVYQLEQSLPEMKQKTGKYIMDMLVQNRQHMKYEDEEKEVNYRISKIEMTLYNQCWDTARAQAEYRKCLNTVREISAEELLELQNSWSGVLCRAREYENAETVAAAAVLHHEQLIALKNSICADSSPAFDCYGYGRSLIQHGQCLAFLGRHEEAISRFNSALKIFEPHSKDWQVAGTFLMHDLIEQQKWSDYFNAVKIFFGSRGIKTIFENIMKGNCGSIPYALFVFLKGLWVSNGKAIRPEYILEIISKIKAVQQKADPEHPWEQIMKYCAFLECRYFEPGNEHHQSEALMDISRRITAKASGTWKIIAEENEKQYRHVVRGEDYTTDSKVNYIFR